MVRHRTWALVAAVSVLAACGGASATRGTRANNLVAIGAGLQGPAGTVATVYAQGLPKVAALAFDPQGRLWVATALSDTGNDGLYLVAGPGATPLEVVTGLHTPLGLLWYQGSLYVASASRVDAFTNFGGAAFQTRRTVVTLPALRPLRAHRSLVGIDRVVSTRRTRPEGGGDRHPGPGGPGLRPPDR
jgi:glucose/arabinose dehydrogenase